MSSQPGRGESLSQPARQGGNYCLTRNRIGGGKGRERVSGRKEERGGEKGKERRGGRGVHTLNGNFTDNFLH